MDNSDKLKYSLEQQKIIIFLALNRFKIVMILFKQYFIQFGQYWNFQSCSFFIKSFY